MIRHGFDEAGMFAGPERLKYFSLLLIRLWLPQYLSYFCFPLWGTGTKPISQGRCFGIPSSFCHQNLACLIQSLTVWHPRLEARSRSMRRTRWRQLLSRSLRFSCCMRSCRRGLFKELKILVSLENKM